jgi:hypothetical protein
MVPLTSLGDPWDMGVVVGKSREAIHHPSSTTCVDQHRAATGNGE